MTFFNYLNAHPFLCFIWFCLIVAAAYGVPVMVASAICDIIRAPRRKPVVTEVTGHGGY